MHSIVGHYNYFIIKANINRHVISAWFWLMVKVLALLHKSVLQAQKSAGAIWLISDECLKHWPSVYLLPERQLRYFASLPSITENQMELPDKNSVMYFIYLYISTNLVYMTLTLQNRLLTCCCFDAYCVRRMTIYTPSVPLIT